MAAAIWEQGTKSTSAVATRVTGRLTPWHRSVHAATAPTTSQPSPEAARSPIRRASGPIGSTSLHTAPATR
jgi:hypothetical protein